MALGIIDKLSHSTVRIECVDSHGNQSSALDFSYGFFEKNQEMVPAIVTNKHVVHGALKGVFSLTLKRADGEPDLGNHMPIEFDNFESLFIKHPDPEVDSAILPPGMPGSRYGCVSHQAYSTGKIAGGV